MGDAMVMHETDNVANCLMPIAAGEEVILLDAGQERRILAGEPIPYGHKIAIVPIDSGALIRKYGRPIGRSTAMIAEGRHVHTHNVESMRARPQESKP